MLPVSSLVSHEDVDPRRTEKLSQRLLDEGRLKNPPVVASIPGTEQYVILDGANRAMAFAQMGIPHIVAQVVSYADPGVVLDTWYHVVSGMPLLEFEESLMKVTGMHLETCSLKDAREALYTNEAAAYIVCESGVRVVRNSVKRSHRDIHLLNRICDAYKGRADIHRASNDIWEIQTPYYPRITALVVFPQFAPSDILSIAQNGEKVPTGITRHIISPRAININIPIGLMWAGWPIEQKEKWLQDWLMERMASNAIRYYAEATFTFDE
jgi:hypothetical protein